MDITIEKTPFKDEWKLDDIFVAAYLLYVTDKSCLTKVTTSAYNDTACFYVVCKESDMDIIRKEMDDPKVTIYFQVYRAAIQYIQSRIASAKSRGGCWTKFSKN